MGARLRKTRPGRSLRILQDELGEIIAVELPDVGDILERGESFGEIESVKTVSDLIAPLSGTISATNDALEDHPASSMKIPIEKGGCWKLS